MKDEHPTGDPAFIVHPSSLLRGVELFNAQGFWHAHEAWEELWLKAAGEEKVFLQGLIQLAAAYHHVQRGTFSGGVRLFDAALRKLEPYADGYLGIDRAETVSAAIEHREKIACKKNIDAGEFPKLRYN